MVGPHRDDGVAPPQCHALALLLDDFADHAEHVHVPLEMGRLEERTVRVGVACCADARS